LTWEDLQVRKYALWKGKRMQAATYVDQAEKLAGKMVALEMRGPGDTKNAMRRIEAKHGIPYQALWSLRYRKPKEVAAHIFAGIIEAYGKECQRQIQLLEHERSITEAKSFIGRAFVAASDALDSEEG
jgi:hypothetical protein